MLKRSTVSGPTMRVDGHQLVERHHGAVVGAHEDMAQVVRLLAEVGLRRQADAIGAAEQREVVDVEAAERALHRVEDRVDRDAERLRLLAVDVDPVLRHAGREGGGDAAQLGPLAGRRRPPCWRLPPALPASRRSGPAGRARSRRSMLMPWIGGGLKPITMPSRKLALSAPNDGAQVARILRRVLALATSPSA